MRSPSSCALLLAIALCTTTTTTCAEQLNPPRRGGRSPPQPRLKSSTGPSAKTAQALPEAPQLLAQVAAAPRAAPSFRWALLHNWLYFLSLGLSVPNLPRVISSIVNPDGSTGVTPASIKVSGDVETVDKALTFLGVGFLCALSDVIGRRALMAWSAAGFGLTCLLQATCRSSVRALFLADFIDGVSSCMSPVCQAYVTDASPPDRRVVNLGIFQGLSIGGAFIIAFPLGGILGKQLGPRVPIFVAAAAQLLNLLLILFVTPESSPPAARAGRKLDLRSANPFGALKRLFGGAPLLRSAAATYFLVTLARGVLDAQFSNYALYRFGWGPQESGPLLVLVGLMLAVAPRLVVPRLGLLRSILWGTLLFAVGQTATAFAPTPARFVGSIFLSSVGCACIPALVALIVEQGGQAERGALLGGLGSLQELCGALGNPLYSRLFAYFISDAAPIKLPGAQFLASAAFLLLAFLVSLSLV